MTKSFYMLAEIERPYLNAPVDFSVISAHDRYTHL